MFRPIPDILSHLIFITGLPRSGTTWAGRAVAAATESVLVEEPFNWKWYPERVKYHMQYLPAGATGTDYVEVLRETTFSWKKPRRSLLVLLSRRVVVRDVLTCLAVEHVWEQLRPHILIVVRHPCAVAASWAKVGFEVDYRIKLLLDQPRLREEHLQPYQAHLQGSKDFYFQIGAYWGATYYVLKTLSTRHPEWQWVTHEALCLQLAEGYRKILQGFGMEMSQRGYKFLTETNREQQAEEGHFSVSRLSAEEPYKWQTRLTSAQISAVIQGAEPFGLLEGWFPTQNPDSRTF